MRSARATKRTVGALALALCLWGCSDDVTACPTTETGEPFMEVCHCELGGGIGLRACFEDGTRGPCECGTEENIDAPTGGTDPATGGGGGGGTGTTTSPPTGTADAAVETPDAAVPLDAALDAAPPPECTADTECSAPEPFCIDQVCVACRTDADCGTNESCDTGHACGPECTVDADCSGATPVCETSSQTCVECLDDDQCDGMTPFCGDAKTCVQCTMPFDCPPCFPPAAPCCREGACTCEGILFCPP